MKKIKTTVTYKVPDGHYCNLNAGLKKSEDKCRFCVKDRHGYRCALYNMPLDTEETVHVKKTRSCEKAMCGFPSIATEAPEIKVDPKQIIKMTLDDFIKTKNQLIAQGYPASMAEKIAKQMVVGGTI